MSRLKGGVHRPGQFGADRVGIALARQQEAASQRAELAIQLGQLLGEEAELTIAAQRLQAGGGERDISRIRASDGSARPPPPWA